MMEYKKVTAIIRTACLPDVEAGLISAGARGLTLTRVAGFGEYANFYQADWMTEHARLELFVPTERVDAIVHAISAVACTGAAGDGIIAVLPVERFRRIREYVRPQDGTQTASESRH